MSYVIDGPVDIPKDFPQDFPERIQSDLFKKFDFSVSYSSVEKETKEEFQDVLLLLIAQISQHYKVTTTQAAEWWIVWSKMSKEQQMKYHLLGNLK